MERTIPFLPSRNSTIISIATKAASIIYRPFDLIGSSVARGAFKVAGVAIPAGLRGRGAHAFVDGARGGGGGLINEGAGAAGGEMSMGLMSALGPWSFLSSGFAVTLVGMAILINRIHHIVPPRRPTNLHLSPILRAGLRLPSLLLLLRGILLLASVLAQYQGCQIESAGLLGPAAKLMGWCTAWAGKSTLVAMIDHGLKVQGSDAGVMWEVFLGVSLAVLSETFVRALDDDLASQTTFNLLSFSFLLHVHSQPPLTETSSFPLQLYIHLLLVLLELFTLHLSYAFSPPLPSFRLAITGTYSLIGQGFVVRGMYLTWIHRGELTELSQRALFANAGNNWEGTVFMNRLPELCFEVVIALTVALRLIAAVLRREEITIDSILGHYSHYPVRNEDFAVGIIKYGSACLESTRLAGLANEVDPITSSPLGYISYFKPTVAPLEISYVHLARGSSSGNVSTREAVGDERVKAERSRAKKEGLGKEIVAVDVEVREVPKDPMSRDPSLVRELLRFLKIVGRIIFYLCWRAYRSVATPMWQLTRKTGYGGHHATLEERWKFTGGIEGDDEEDEDYEPSESEESSSDLEGSGDESSGGEKDERPADAPILYRDLATSPSRRHQQRYLHRNQTESVTSPTASSSIDFQQFDRELSPESGNDSEAEGAENYMPIMLAHHLSTASSPPLTRRRYQTLLKPSLVSSDQQLAFSTVIADRQNALLIGQGEGARQPFEDDGRQRLCVVCTVEERVVICWPCRCLSLCEECREHLAERTKASSHLCPTCRTPVKGFSRIFIP